MSNESNVQVWTAHVDAALDGTGGAWKKSFTSTRPIKVTALKFVGFNPSETDGDTTAIDLSYSTDGFSSSDVEIAALAAVEYNDTDKTIGTNRTSINIPLTTAALDADGVTVRVPANAVIEMTITCTGAPADINFSVCMEYIPL